MIDTPSFTVYNTLHRSIEKKGEGRDGDVHGGPVRGTTIGSTSPKD